MRNILGYFILHFFVPLTTCMGQKPVLDTSALRNWITVEDGQISSDGKFVSYAVVPASGRSDLQREVVVRACDGQWKRSFPTATTSASFSVNGHLASLILSHDTLAILQPNTDQVDYIKGVNSVRFIQDYLLYTSNDDSKHLSLMRLSDRSTSVLDSVLQYTYDDQREGLILLKRGIHHDRLFTYYSLTNRKEDVIWEGELVDRYYFDQASGNFAFIGKIISGKRGIWLWRPGNRKAVWLLGEREIAIDSSHMLQRIHGFSKRGDQLFVAAQPQKSENLPPQQPSDAAVAIWRYTDHRMKSQDERYREVPEYIYAIDINSKASVRINQKFEKIIDLHNDFGLVRQFSGRGDWEEADWNPYSQFKTILVSFKDGYRRDLPMESPNFSTTGRFLLYFDPVSKDYYTYNLMTDSIINITRSITALSNKIPTRFYAHVFSGDWDYQSYWMSNDSAVILYGERDIWLVDPTGEKPPVNITHEYGATHKILFHPVEEFSSIRFRKGEKITLAGFNFSTKQNGFYTIRWGMHEDPQQLVMNDCVYYTPHVVVHNGLDNRPVKAAQANVWLIKRMSEQQSPNYFVTKDFRSFAPVSDVYPENGYNWLTSELHTWKSFNGDSLQGILYKPENFNPHTRYPVLFYYYEEFSNNLHSYFIPELFIGPINIPYMVSQGYLIFVPDIHYQIGEPGMSAYNSVVSAAIYLSKKSFVDSTKMGIQGHSFGGYETNFILTQTNKFTAACSASGITDLIAFSGGITAQGKSTQWMSSKGQIRLGVKLWDDLERYIKNSPLFYLNNINTPLLIMHTTDDKPVPFGQALELFNGLRQFRKKTWMLIYKGEDHKLTNYNNSCDYTARTLQFFDYYLKGKEMPAWMVPEE